MLGAGVGEGHAGDDAEDIVRGVEAEVADAAGKGHALVEVFALDPCLELARGVAGIFADFKGGDDDDLDGDRCLRVQVQGEAEDGGAEDDAQRSEVGQGKLRAARDVPWRCDLTISRLSKARAGAVGSPAFVTCMVTVAAGVRR